MGFWLELATELLRAWRSGSQKSRTAIVTGGGFAAIGGLVLLLSNVPTLSFFALQIQFLGASLVALGSLTLITVYAIEKSKEQVQQQRKIEAVEKRVQENPQETQAAWELARVKLESYLNRNLSQVRSIFYLTALVMIAGFTLIGVGSYQAFEQPDRFKASVLSSISGIVVSFIGGTFLILYKATMAQAKDYVTILERINAVGMSVQILESLNEGDTNLKHQTIAAVATQLLSMYSHDVIPAGVSHRTSKARAAGQTQ